MLASAREVGCGSKRRGIRWADSVKNSGRVTSRSFGATIDSRSDVSSSSFDSESGEDTDMD